MIDTIILTLTQGTFEIINPDAFIPSARWAVSENTYTACGILSKQNPTKKKLASGLYKPRLTLLSRLIPLSEKKHCLKLNYHYLNFFSATTLKS